MTCSIELSGVNLWRRTQEEYSFDLKRRVFAFLEGRYRSPSRRHVLRDISFAIHTGEKVGIIGPNGSGKSTLLKVIAGILLPTNGRVHVEGSIAPLIELGAGFDPDLTVIDNIEYYAILLGHRREYVRSRVDAILNFAQLYDHAREPVKALSSGMTARLGFAIATEVRPDILILDEILSVGDESFRRRSSERLASLWNDRTTVLFVSHDAASIRAQCSRAILLEEGEIIKAGPADEVLDEYDRRLSIGTARTGHAASTFDHAAIMRMTGHLFRGNGTTWEEQKLFVIRDGCKHWVRDASWMGDNGFDWSRDVTYVEGGQLAEIPDGDPI